MSYERQRAITLNAATIAEVLTIAGFPQLLQNLTATQRQQLQRYLDALVVDPVVRQEADAWYHKGTKYYGQLVVVDPAMKNRADKIMRGFIPIGKHDDRVRLNLAQLLDKAAFVPKSDNPDEADYLERVHKTLNTRGVWLRLAPRLVRDTDDPSRWVSDPRHFQVWLSLGPDGDHIPTRSGRIDREALLSTTTFGAGYYMAVDNGPMQRALDREVRNLSSQIDDGMAQHFELARIRRDAAIGVVGVSDALGGASFPSDTIWKAPHQLLLRAMEWNNAGRIYGCRTLLVTAAIATRNAGHLLARYIEDSTSGAQSAVKVLVVARTAGKVAEVGLAITGVAALVTRGVGAVGSMAATEASIDSLAERELANYLRRNPEIASEISGELNQVKLIRGPKGTISGNIKGGHSSGIGEGFRNW